MLIQALALAFLAGDFIYHRYFEDHDRGRRDQTQVQLPRTSAGVTIPLIIGRCRARTPILVWNAAPQFGDNGFSPEEFQMNMFFVLGIGMQDNEGDYNRVHGMWIGDTKCRWQWTGTGDTQTGDGNHELAVQVYEPITGGLERFRGRVETLNGKPTQVLVDDAGISKTFAGDYMLGIADDIPGYRGFMSLTLHAFGVGTGDGMWRIGQYGSVPPYSFEVASYATGDDYPAVDPNNKVGDDCNPVNALYDLYVAKFSRAGLDASLIDMPTWSACADRCVADGIGYSRYIDDASQLDDKIREILEIIDGVPRWNPHTGKVELKLVRKDYDPDTIPHLTDDNTESVTGFAMSGWATIPNIVNVVFTDRARNYKTNTVSARNPANTVRQDGQANEITIQALGICEKVQAQAFADRERDARSVPIMKFRAAVARNMFGQVRQGDAVKVTLSRPPIDGGIFRVCDVDLGTVDNGKVLLDLMTETAR